jgi:hypothetical protein
LERADWAQTGGARTAGQTQPVNIVQLEENKLFEDPFIVSIIRRRKKKFSISNLLYVIVGPLM